MRGSHVGREARRRPELDLMVGTLEAATIQGEGSRPDVAPVEDLELEASPPSRRGE